MSKGQTSRLTKQHKSSGGATGIFGEDAQVHDKNGLHLSDNEIVSCDNYTGSCCCCKYKEDHYCLFRSVYIKNMDIKTCKYWR